MNLDNYRIIFIGVGLIGVLLFASPMFGLLIKPHAGEKFSELYLLGPNHTLGNLPVNIKANVTYTVYLGIGNHMGSSIYYTCAVKLRNTSEPLPNQNLGTATSMPSLYEYKICIKDGQKWEVPLTFKVNGLSFSNNNSNLESITINEKEFSVQKTVVLNPEDSRYYYDLFIELWIYNVSKGTFQYHNRFVQLYVNVAGNI